MSAGKAAALVFIACISFWALFFAVLGIGLGLHRLLLAGSYTLIFAGLCAAWIHELYRETS